MWATPTEMELIMRAVITVIGKDTVGILAKVSTICAQNKANVIDVTQTVMQDLFAMIMLTDITHMDTDIASLKGKMADLAQTQGLSIHVMHEDIFNSMHTI